MKRFITIALLFSAAIALIVIPQAGALDTVPGFRAVPTLQRSSEVGNTITTAADGSAVSITGEHATTLLPALSISQASPNGFSIIHTGAGSRGQGTQDANLFTGYMLGTVGAGGNLTNSVSANGHASCTVDVTAQILATNAGSGGAIVEIDADDQLDIGTQADDAAIRIGTGTTNGRAITIGTEVGTTAIQMLVAAGVKIGTGSPAVATGLGDLYVTNAIEVKGDVLTNDGTNSAGVVATGSKKTLYTTPVSLGDEAAFLLPDASTGRGWFLVGDNEEYFEITWKSDGTFTFWQQSGTVVGTDTDTKFCVIDGGTQISIKNRLGAAKEVVFNYDYTT